MIWYDDYDNNNNNNDNIFIMMKREVISNKWESSTSKADIDLICWIKDIWN